jgi:hypothetical protein
MGKLDDIKKLVSELFDRVQDPEVVKPLASVRNLIDEAQAEESEFLVKHNQLKSDYVKAIKTQVVSESPEVDPPPRKEKSPEQILRETGLDKKIKLGA